jgi:hypothetical protein
LTSLTPSLAQVVTPVDELRRLSPDQEGGYGQRVRAHCVRSAFVGVFGAPGLPWFATCPPMIACNF